MNCVARKNFDGMKNDVGSRSVSERRIAGVIKNGSTENGRNANGRRTYAGARTCCGVELRCRAVRDALAWGAGCLSLQCPREDRP